MGIADPFDLNRFVEAQESVYSAALTELQAGKKQTHWMWFIFPQIDGLGYSWMARHYAVHNANEARAYLAHTLLGPRLLECSAAVLAIDGASMSEVFGFPDDAKLRSSMTLFAQVAGRDSLFARVLDKHFGGQRDDSTLELLERTEKSR
jgi:uncharacterized protein (DUF1810 family)